MYPLSEDLRPGDVFLVTLPVHRQTKLYKTKGFLPLDQLTTRLEGEDEYKRFYSDAFLKGFADDIPYERSALGPSGAAPGCQVQTSCANPVGDNAGQPQPPLENAAEPSNAVERMYTLLPIPTAHFPTSTFDVESGQGLRLALPIQGIPVALGLLRTDKATGSVIIRNAYTYALPADVLLRRLHHWAREPLICSELARLKHSVGEERIYLRVVNRVYFVGGVEVVLIRKGALAAGADAGIPQKIDLVGTSTADLQKLKDNAKLLNDIQAELVRSLTDVQTNAAGDLLPGGSARIAYATSRQVKLDADFRRLLAVGYLGFDVEVLERGCLGPLVSTFYQLQKATPQLHLGDDMPSSVTVWSRVILSSIHEALEEMQQESDSEAEKQTVEDLLRRLKSLTTHLPRQYPVDVFHRTSGIDVTPVEAYVTYEAGSDVKRDSFDDMITYWAALDRSLSAIRKAIDSEEPLQLTDRDTTDPTEKITADLLERYQIDTERELRKLGESLNADPVMAESAEFWYHRILTKE